MSKGIKERAREYFAAQGVNTNERPKIYFMPSRAEVEHVAGLRKAGDGVTTQACTIEVTSVLFYTYLEVIVPDIGYKFSGSAGGLGVGDLESAGVLYYSDKDTLLGTHAFGVTFLAEDGGVVQVTWGTHGNASAAGIGEGGGAFGGSGKWEKL